MATLRSNRRDFLKTSTLGIGSVLMLPSCLKNYSPWQFFSPEEALCMAAICEQIIPADENGPGASQAGVIYYIDKQLDEVFTWDQEYYQQGIAAIQQNSNSMHNMNFEALDQELQFNFLKKMEANQLPSAPWSGLLRQSSLFNKMIQHTMQGFYGSPRHGGNKNYISYRMMKLDYPYIVGQNRYRESTDQK